MNMDLTIKNDLIKMLRNVFDDKEFITCIVSHLKTDRVRKGFIDYMNMNPGATSEELTLLSITVHRENL